MNFLLPVTPGVVTGLRGGESYFLFFVVASLISLCLIIGVLTPYLSFIVCISAPVNFFGVGASLEGLIFASLLLNSAALALVDREHIQWMHNGLDSGW